MHTTILITRYLRARLGSPTCFDRHKFFCERLFLISIFPPPPFLLLLWGDCMIMHSVISLNSISMNYWWTELVCEFHIYMCIWCEQEKWRERNGDVLFCCAVIRSLGPNQFYSCVSWRGETVSWTGSLPVDFEQSSRILGGKMGHSTPFHSTQLYRGLLNIFICRSVLFSFQPSLCLFWDFFFLWWMIFLSFFGLSPFMYIAPLLQGVGLERRKRSCRPYEYHGFRNLSDGVDKATVFILTNVFW